jgi:predicted RNase H-like HicB family nuclease
MCAGETKGLSRAGPVWKLFHNRSQPPGRGFRHRTLETNRKRSSTLLGPRMAETMSRYTVRYKRDETGWWVATVKEVRGCHTQGRTIDQARRRIREALSLFVEDSEEAELVDDIALPANARTLVNEVLATRRRAEGEAAKLQDSTTKAAHILIEDVGVSVRDAGELLGLSHQRVHQLLTTRSQKTRK